MAKGEWSAIRLSKSIALQHPRIGGNSSNQQHWKSACRWFDSVPGHQAPPPSPSIVTGFGVLGVSGATTTALAHRSSDEGSRLGDDQVIP